ncbi:hypothetical protein [Sphingobacterium sp.]
MLYNSLNKLPKFVYEVVEYDYTAMANIHNDGPNSHTPIFEGDYI